MDFRDSKSRLILIVVALGAVLVVAVASCGGGGGDDGGGDDGQGNEQTTQATSEGGSGSSGGGEDTGGEEPEDQPAEPLAEVSGGESLTLTVTSAQRESGDFLTLQGTLHNGGSETYFDLGWAGGEKELAENGFSMAGATLVATEESKRYLILRDTDGRCLCTLFGNGIDDGDTVQWFAQFPAPKATTTQVQLHVGDLPPATVEIG